MHINLKQFEKNRVLKREPIALMRAKFQITSCCNAKCKHCTLWRKKPILLKEKIMFKAIADLSRMGCKEIDFTGGEPTTHPFLLKFIKKVSGLKMHPRINTNGFNVTESLAKKLVLAGITKYAISIDSPLESEHDDMRRLDNLWSRAMDSINLINKYRKKFNRKIRIVLYSIVTNKNYNKLEKLFELKKIANFDEINLIPIKDQKNKQLFLSEEQLTEYHSRIIPNLVKLYGKFKLKGLLRTINCTFGGLETPACINQASEGRYSGDVYKKIPCFVPQFYAYVDSKGNVLPCCVAPHHMKTQYVMGNIYEESIEKIWNSARYNALRKYLEKPSLKICSGCSGTMIDFNKRIYAQVTNEKL